MDNIIYRKNPIVKKDDILDLYRDVGWESYLKEYQKLIKGLNNSLCLITANDHDQVVGLIRVVGDGQTIIYIQDILVLREYQRRGIGRKLLKMVIDKYSNVRQQVLLTDDIEATKAFYQANGFVKSGELGLVSFVRFN